MGRNEVDVDAEIDPKERKYDASISFDISWIGSVFPVVSGKGDDDDEDEDEGKDEGR